MGSMLETRYRGTRRHLDKLGYQNEALPVEALSLVERILIDFGKTSDTLKTVTERADHFAKLVQEFEGGVEPFKEETVRLTKENSELRLGILRANEKVDKDILANRSRLRDLESQNTDLKLLVKQFVTRLKGLELESFHKTKRIADLQERNLEAVVISTDGERRLVATRKQRMEINCPAPPCCQHCIRIRNFVEFGGTKWKDPSALDYIKIADSRIECLQLQSRCLKRDQKALTETIGALEIKVEERDKEIDRLRHGLHTQPGGKMLLSTVSSKNLTSEPGEHALRMSLKASQLQLTILHKRNIDLEAKLQESVLDGHHKFMSGRASGVESRIIDSLVHSIDGGFPTYVAMSLEEKNKLLEAQLSHCCKEKAKLKYLLEQCESRHRVRHRSSPTVGPSTSGFDGIDYYDDFDDRRASSRSPSRTKTRKVGFQSQPETRVISKSESQNNGLDSRQSKAQMDKTRQNLSKRGVVSQKRSGAKNASQSKQRVSPKTSVPDSSDLDSSDKEVESRSLIKQIAEVLRSDGKGRSAKNVSRETKIQSENQVSDQRRGQSQVPVVSQRQGRSDVVRLESEHSDDEGIEDGSDVQHDGIKQGYHHKQRKAAERLTNDPSQVEDEQSTKGHSLSRRTSEELAGGLGRKLRDEDAFEQRRVADRPTRSSQVDDVESTNEPDSRQSKDQMDKRAQFTKQDQSRNRDVSQKDSGTEKASQSKQRVPPRTSAPDPSDSSNTEDRSLSKPVAERSELRKTMTGPTGDIQSRQDREKTERRDQVQDGNGGQGRLTKRQSENQVGGQRRSQPEVLVGGQRRGQSQVPVGGQRRVQSKVSAGEGQSRRQSKVPTGVGQSRSQSKVPVDGQTRGQSKVPIGDQKRSQSEVPVDGQTKGQSKFPVGGPTRGQSKAPTGGQRQPRSDVGRSESEHSDDERFVDVDEQQVEIRQGGRGHHGQRGTAQLSNNDPAQVDDAESAKEHSLTRNTSDELAGGLHRNLPDEGLFERRRVMRPENDPSQNDDTESTNTKRHPLTRKASLVDLTGEVHGNNHDEEVRHEQRGPVKRPTYDHTDRGSFRDASGSDRRVPGQSQARSENSDNRQGTVESSAVRQGTLEQPGGARVPVAGPSQRSDISETGDPHLLNRVASEALAGGLDRNLLDEYQQYNVRLSQPENLDFMNQRKNHKESILAPAGQDAIVGVFLNAPGVENRKTAQPSAASMDYIGSDAESVEILRTFEGRNLSQSTIPHRTETRTILPGDSFISVGRGPTQAEWLTLNSDVEAYRKEIERLRNVLFSKEDQIDQLSKDNEVTQRKLKNAQTEQRKEPPPSTQSLIRRLEDERDTFEKSLRLSQTSLRDMERKVSGLEGSVRDGRNLQARLRESEKNAEAARWGLKESETERARMERELNHIRREFQDIQTQAQQFRREAESAKDTLEETERLLLETRKQQYQVTPSTQPGARLELTQQQLQQFSNKELSYEREIISLKSAIKVLDRDKDEMRVELDRKDCRLAKLQSEIGQYMEELARLNLRQQNLEILKTNNEETLRAQEHDLLLLRRQAEVSRRELEQMSRDREEALKELRRVTTTHSMGEIERKNISTELDKRNKEADELRRQVHQYIEEVRRIEELLQAKDEEHEMILNQYRNLSAEKTTLEMHRSSLERETDTVRKSARDAMEHTSTLRSQLSRQNTLVKSYEEEIERLSNQVASLETQLSSVRDSEQVLNKDTKVARDYHIKMEKNLDDTRLKLADAESSQKQMDAENRDLRRHLVNLEQEITLANENYKKLDEIVAAARENEFKLRRSIDERTAERDELKNQILALTSRVDSLNDEFARSRLKCIELQTELDKLNRLLSHEKSARETASEELRRLQDSLNTSSTNMLLSRALDSSRRSPSPTPRLGASTESRLPFSRSLTPPQLNPSSPFTPSDPMDSPLAASTSRPAPDSQPKPVIDPGDKYEPW